MARAKRKRKLPRVLKVQAASTREPLEEGGTGFELEETEGEDQITEPFDPTKIRVESKPLPISNALERMTNNEIDLKPGFQRRAGIWNDDAQSRLIESILIRIPLPAFYFDATDEDCWLVVDGLQRLTALRRFVIDKDLKLDGLEFLSQFEGAGFDNLPRNFQRRIRETVLTAYLIQQGTPSDVKFTVFKRINTGGLPLSAQEIRHALFQGKATTLLEVLAGSDEFKQATANGVKDKRMGDRECVLRFIAFALTPYTEYTTGEWDKFLNTTMEMLNSMQKDQLEELRRRFKRSMNAAQTIFGRDAFRKRYDPDAGRRPISKALFESWSVNLDSLSDAKLKALASEREDVKDRFIRLMNQRDFDNSISQGTGDVGKVHTRFKGVKDIIKETLS